MRVRDARTGPARAGAARLRRLRAGGTRRGARGMRVRDARTGPARAGAARLPRMRLTTTRLFPLGLMLALALLTFYLERAVREEESQPARRRHDPDYIVSN